MRYSQSAESIGLENLCFPSDKARLAHEAPAAAARQKQGDEPGPGC